MKLDDAVVVVTGASSGIGRAAAVAFAERTDAVVLAARRRDALEEVAKECADRGARTLVVPTDASDHEQMQALAQRAIETFGRIDVWVNNAAVTMFARIEDAPMDQYRRVIETNLLGYVHGARAALPVFRAQGQGVLVNVGSVVSRVPETGTSAYVVSKWGILGLTECLQLETADAKDIHVTAVLPASTDTPLFHNAANHTGHAIQPIPPVAALWKSGVSVEAGSTACLLYTSDAADE